MSRLVQFHLSTINPHSLREQLSQIFADQPTVFKINLSFGFILQNTETRALQYHHPSANNNLVLEQPFLVSNQDDFELLYDQIRNIDSMEWVHQQRPSSKWVVDLIMNITWFVWKIHDHPISRGKYLPGYIVENRGIIPLDRKIQRGKPYEEKEKVQELKNTDKLNWESAHEPLSVSVCSSVPDYEELKCFVSEGDSDLLLEEFVQYLTTISSKSSSLLCQQYAEVFEALKRESVPSRGITEDDQLAQILVHIQEGNVESGEDENSEEESEDQSRDIDLMGSDNEEDEEQIELENEKDRTFLDDEIQEQEDVSFYRRFHVGLNRGLRQEQRQQRQELATYEDMLFGQEQTSDNKVLIQLEEKLNAYIQELPVLGFNSGKYDLNDHS